MAIEITMPALSPTMEEGKLAKWLVKKGDTVSSGDVIAEIETDKATMEVEAVDEGTVAKILVEEGSEGVKVNSVIAMLAEDGEDASDVSASGGDAVPPKQEVEGRCVRMAWNQTVNSFKNLPWFGPTLSRRLHPAYKFSFQIMHRFFC